MDERNLPTTTFAILGMLTFGEMSGYDLSKFVEKSIGYFWSPAKSQIYSELRRLVDLGFAVEQEVRQEDRPDKRVYRITGEGEEALRAWLHDQEVEQESYKNPLLLKLFFGRLMDHDALRAQLEGIKGQAAGLARELGEVERQIKGEEEFFYPYMTLKAGLAHARATARWADDVLRHIGEREEVSR